ncbi:hypothetical protein M758_3G146600 [Ceratodon purpureus]|nr:hypothetical protein M758_3G146600 [Ceratodon purpureus]
MVGNLPALAGAMLHQNLQQLAAKFGPVMYLRLGSVPYVVVSTAEVARAFVRASDEYLSSRPRLLSFSILSENRTMATAPSPGKLWHSLRKFGSSELLFVNRVASYEGTRREELRNMMQVLLETSTRGEAINLKFWLFQTAANLTTRMLVNKRIYYGRKANSYQEEIEKEFEQVYFTAAVETSSTMLEWAMAELVANPEIMKRAQDEVDTIAGKDRLVQESDIPNSPFCKQSLKKHFACIPHYHWVSLENQQPQ